MENMKKTKKILTIKTAYELKEIIIRSLIKNTLNK